MVVQVGRLVFLYLFLFKLFLEILIPTQYLTVRHNLLPPRHFGGLPNRMTVDSLLYLTHQVKEAWRKRKVATIIFLDIVNAFPNAVTNQLLKNMAKLLE